MKHVSKDNAAPLSLRKFSRLAGVSPATVSRVFSGGVVAEPTKRRVLGLAERMSFRPSAVGATHFGSKTRSVGVILPDLRISYFSEIACGLQSSLIKKGYLPITLTITANRERELVRRLVDHRVDAVAMNLTDESIDWNDIKELLFHRIPIVSMSRFTAGAACDVVETDDEEGGRLAARRLASLGHRRIGFIYYGEGNSTCEPRFDGFRIELAKKGIHINESDIVRVSPREPHADERQAEKIKELITRKKRPTAVFAPTDLIARIVCEVASRAGLRVPEDLSVVGFADLDFAGLHAPPLTTIRQDGIAVGKAAAEMILKRISGYDAPPQRHLIPVDLVVRESDSAPAAG